MRSSRTLALALAAMTSVPGSVRAGENADLARQLRAAVKPLLAPSPGDAEGNRRLVEVMGITARVGERAGLPSEVVARLREAHAVWSQSTNDLPHPAVKAALGQAYAALHGGRPFAFPPSVRTIDEAREVCRQAIDGAAAALEAGRFPEATRGMVEFILLAATPMEAK